MSEVIRDKNTINREDIEDLEKYIEEQVVDIIVRQKIKETIESLYDVIDDLGENTTQMQTIKNTVEVLYSTFEKSEEELEETNNTESVRIVGENVSEDALRKIYCEYMSRDSDFDDSDYCEVCSLP